MKALGLFSGIGGFELGLQRAGFSIGGLCEIDESCGRVLNKNFPHIEVLKDVKNICPLLGEYDIICGGFPCTDISIAGKGKGGINGEKSGLWHEFLKTISKVRPKYALVENVFGLRSRGLEELLQGLSQIGYDAEYTTFDTQYFGSPQRRRRIYILAVRDGIPSGADIFNNKQRSTKECRQKVQHIDKGRRWHFKEGEGKRTQTAFFTRQRSDEFKETGLSSTLAKRDYKSFTDLVLEGMGGLLERIRRVTPEERLLLQGFPIDWFSGLGIQNSAKFSMNGMSVATVEHIGKLILDFDNEYKKKVTHE
jgi:DNA (cytosine-5)-methyltransferase 1